MQVSGYKIIKKIFEDQNSIIYQASKEEKEYALKVLNKTFPSQEEAFRFYNEYEILKNEEIYLSRKIYERLEIEKKHILVMEYFSGITLKQFIAEFQKESSLSFLILVAIQITKALAEIHKQGIIHKDYNSNNILIDKDNKIDGGLIRIIDFGLSTKLEIKKHYQPNTRMEGTIYYLSPEQTGRMNRIVDYRSDLYSLGVVLYELFTGELPFNSKDIGEVIYFHIAKVPKLPNKVNATIPQIISEIIMKLISKNAEERYQSAFGVQHDLERYLEMLEIYPNKESIYFTIAEADFSDKLHISQKLYGRAEEVATIFDYYSSVCEGEKIVLLVGGRSGVGKSALVYEVLKSFKLTSDFKSYFLTGKFDQNQRNVPYFVWKQIFKELVESILTQNIENVNFYKYQFIEIIAGNYNLVLDIIPELEWIIGKPKKEKIIDSIKVKISLNHIIINLLKTILSNSIVVIFIDDIQWVDSSSMDLIQAIIQEESMNNLFLICSYRDNEFDPNKLLKDNSLIYKLHLRDLSFSDLNNYVSGSLKLSTDSSKELTEILYSKTHGNPFFTGELLKSIYEKGILYFRYPTKKQEIGKWVWDSYSVQNLNVTENVVDLLLDKIRKLPEKSRRLLTLSACLGNRFSLDTLALISGTDIKALYYDLELCIKEGFIQPLTEGYRFLTLENNYYSEQTLNFKFTHDRIQQSAYNLESELKQKTHLNIGSVLYDKYSKNNEELEEKIYDIVFHYNIAKDYIKTKNEADIAIHLNMIAGRKSKASASFQEALEFYLIAMDLLDVNAWEEDYYRTLFLYNELLECYFLIGDNENVNRIFPIILRNAKKITDCTSAYKIIIWNHTNRSELKIAIEYGLEFLQKLNLDLFKKRNLFNTILEFINTKFFLTNKKLKQLYSLPEMKDEIHLSIVQLLVVLLPTVLFYNPKLAPVIVIKQFSIVKKYGNVFYSPYIYCTYAALLCSYWSSIEKGYKLGLIALEKEVSKGKKDTLVKVNYVFYSFVSIWKKNLKETLDPLKKGYLLGLDIGDFEYSAYSAFNYCLYNFYSGINLKDLTIEINSFSESIFKANQTTSHNFFILLETVVHSYILNLSNQDLTNYNKTINIIREKEDKTAQAILCTLKTMQYFILRKYEEALEYIDEFHRYKDSLLTTFNYPVIVFYETLIYLNLQNKKYKKKIDRNIRKMKNWKNHCPDNFTTYYHLMFAEYLRVYNKEKEAIENYNAAINFSKKQNLIYTEAIARELLGSYLNSIGWKEMAIGYLSSSISCYKLWGADFKVKQLEFEYPELAFRNSLSNSNKSSISYFNNPSIDMNSLIKASQTLSEEMNLNELLGKMDKLLIENAGAEGVCLLMEKEEDWSIEIYNLSDKKPTSLNNCLNDELPLTLIHYVIRTSELIVLDNALDYNKFLSDPYVQKNQSKSILCIPLIRKQKLSGVLYLENNLSYSAFTRDRVEVIKTLSSQIVISIENARLYTNMKDLNLSYQRFVPREFLSFLEKKSITQVGLGNQIEKEMIVLFTDIRNFTKLSETMTPQENFNFLNSYLSRMEPIIKIRHGFIDKYIGDSIMALFDGVYAEDSILSGIEILKELEVYNNIRKGEGLEPIHIGIGLNEGRVIIGTIGGNNRMDTTVIGDAVNLASRVESLTKTFKLDMLCTDSVYKHIKDPTKFNMREIDTVRVKGKQEPVTIFEIFESDRPELKEKKILSLSKFQTAIHLYKKGEFKDALKLFEECHKESPEDMILPIYLTRCNTMIRIPPGPSWTGVSTL